MNSAISDFFTTISIGAATILLGHLAAWTFGASRRSFPDRLSKRVSFLKELPSTIAVVFPLALVFGLGALIRSIECSECGLFAPLDLIPALCVLAWVFRIVFGLIFLWALGTWIYWVNRSGSGLKKKATRRAGKRRDRSKRMLLRSLATGIVLILFYLFFCCEENNRSGSGSPPSCAACPSVSAPPPDCAICEKAAAAKKTKAAPAATKADLAKKKAAAANRPKQKPEKKQGKGKGKPRRR